MLRVTQILRLAGLVDFSGIDPAVLEAARRRGVAVHHWIDGTLRGLLDGESPESEIAPYIVAWEKASAELRLVVEAHEVNVEHAKYGYRGRLDLLTGVTGVPWLLDIKTSREVHPSTALQTMAYSMALGDRRKRGALHLRRDGSWALVEFSTDREDEHAFLACLHVARFKLQHGLASLDD